MTRNEAIKVLNTYDVNFDEYTAEEIEDAIDMAIEALQTKTDGDLISRTDAIEAVENEMSEAWTESDADINRGMEYALSIINALPSAEAVEGEWEDKEIFNDTNDDHIVDKWQSARCSVCGWYHTTPFIYYFNNFNFCPNCGARMKGAEHEID